MHFLWMAALHSDKEAKMKETSQLDLIIYFLDSEVMLLIIKGSFLEVCAPFKAISCPVQTTRINETYTYVYIYSLVC